MKSDVLIIGGGPAGVTAALYTARAGFKTAIICKDHGALGKAERVDNFYGHLEIGGDALVEIGLEQARNVGAEIITGEVVGLLAGENITVQTTDAEYHAKAVLLATGANRVTPKIPGIAEYEGCGVSYCAICDGFFYKGKDVAVLGNGSYALHEVEDLLPLAASVTLLTDGREPEVAFPDSVTIRNEKVLEAFGGAVSTAFIKKNIFQGIRLETGESSSEELPFSGLFIAIGIAGGTDLARKMGAALDA